MAEKLILIPAADAAESRILRMPSDMNPNEAFRNITGIVAGLEEAGATPSREDVDEALEDNGFELLAFEVGPALE